MQQIEKTEAIVLQVIPFSETSHVVTWLTPERGRIATMVKGARRAKSPFLGQYDQFYTCELVYYRREQTGMHIARECCPLLTRDALRTNWRASAVASYAAGLSGRASLEGSHQHETYELLRMLLDFVSRDGVKLRLSLLYWFELQLLGALGLAPHLTICTVCGKKVQQGAPAHYSFRSSGIVCAACPTTDARSELHLRPDVLAILRGWSGCEDPRAAQNTVVREEQVFPLRALFDTLLDQLAGVSTVHRLLAEEALAAP